MSKKKIFTLADMKSAFDAGREYEGHCDKSGKPLGVKKEEWKNYLKHRTFTKWIKASNV